MPTNEELMAALTQLEAKLTELSNKGSEDKPARSDADSELANDISPEVRDLLDNPEAIREMGRIADKKAQAQIDAAAYRTHVIEFASKIAGGSKDKPFGLPVRTTDLVALLLSLPKAQAKAVESILEQTWNKAIDFAEHGLSGSDFQRRRIVPATMRRSLSQWVAAKKDPEEFFDVNPEMGNAADYDLTEFYPKSTKND